MSSDVVGGDTTGFRHEALLYAGEAEFVDRISSFIREGVESGEPILVVVSAGKIDLLRSELGVDAKAVQFADMADVGSNPARIIPAWNDFVDEHGGRGHPFRGVGEPIWAARDEDELIECERHEALLNLAFANAPAWRLLCPYDTETLSRPVIDEALRNHPIVLDDGGHRRTTAFRDLSEISKPFDAPLPDSPADAHEVAFAETDLVTVRAGVAGRATRFGLDPSRVDDLVLAVDEVVTNSLRYGGGGGVLRTWEAGDVLISEVRDRGRIEQPLIGRKRPEPDQTSGFGFWLMNQLCDLVQVRTYPTGSVVRLHMKRR